MIRKPQIPQHVREPSAYFPKATLGSRQHNAGSPSSMRRWLIIGGLLSATFAPSLFAEEIVLGSLNWQQWQEASQSAEAIVNDEVNDSGLLLDAIADEPDDSLIIDDQAQARYGASASWLLRGEPYFIDKISLGPRQVGVASWYGPGFNGRPTASGEIFDMHQLTAAHRTLPLPSYIRVTHVGNGRSVIVKVNDRGPYHSKRVLDLSYAAAQALGFKGVARVSIEPVEQGRTGHLRKGEALDDAEVYRVRLGNFSNADVAHALESRLLAIMPKGVGIDVIRELEPERAYRVSVGPMLTREEAELVIRGLRAQRLGLLMTLDIRPSPAP